MAKLADESLIWLVRHGETEWSRSGAHTGNTDIPLTEAGAKSAANLGKSLRDYPGFNLVLTSPRKRALETCRLGGFGEIAVVDQDLREWNYGDYEGRTTAEIRSQVPGWNIWDDGVPNGESVEHVSNRAARVIEKALLHGGRVLLFSHGHLLRILTAAWLGLPPSDGKLFALPAGTISTLGYERETRVITSWGIQC